MVSIKIADAKIKRMLSEYASQSVPTSLYNRAVNSIYTLPGDEKAGIKRVNLDKAPMGFVDLL